MCSPMLLVFNKWNSRCLIVKASHVWYELQRSSDLMLSPPDRASLKKIEQVNMQHCMTTSGTHLGLSITSQWRRTTWMHKIHMMYRGSVSCRDLARSVVTANNWSLVRFPLEVSTSGSTESGFFPFYATADCHLCRKLLLGLSTVLSLSKPHESTAPTTWIYFFQGGWPFRSSIGHVIALPVVRSIPWGRYTCYVIGSTRLSVQPIGIRYLIRTLIAPLKDPTKHISLGENKMYSWPFGPNQYGLQFDQLIVECHRFSQILSPLLLFLYLSHCWYTVTFVYSLGRSDWEWFGDSSRRLVPGIAHADQLLSRLAFRQWPNRAFVHHDTYVERILPANRSVGYGSTVVSDSRVYPVLGSSRVRSVHLCILYRTLGGYMLPDSGPFDLYRASGCSNY